MSLFSRAVHILNPVIGGATQAAGAIGSLGGLAKNSTADRLTSIGHSITNPNVVYAGPINPLASNFGASGGQAWTTTANKPSATPAVDITGTVQGADTMVPGSGIYGAGGAGGGAKAYDPNTDPAVMARLKGDIGNLMDVFHSAFNEVLNKVDQMAATKKADITKNYEKQHGNLDTNYGSTAQAIDNIMAGQGAFNSSYRAVQQGTAKDAYKSAVDALGVAQDADLGNLGQYADTTKAGLRASMPQYNVDNYQTVSDLQVIKDNVDQALGQLGVTGAGLGTQGEYVSHLNAITPKQETGSAVLKGQLDKLSGVNAPVEAKQAIAEQIINNQGGDPAWLDYFNKILAQAGSNAVSPVVASTPLATATPTPLA